MAIASLLLLFEEERESELRAALAKRPELTVGPTTFGRLPVVAETGDAGDLDGLMRSLCALEGVHFADIVGVEFGEDMEEELDATA